MELLLLAIALFPWSLVVLGAAALVRRRLQRARSGEALDYIPPSSREPILIDSAQLVQSLKEHER